MYDGQPVEAQKSIQFIIIMIWLHWWFVQFLVLIILLNFLLAMVTQAFDEVIDEKITPYEQRADLNVEYRYIRNAVTKLYPSCLPDMGLKMKEVACMIYSISTKPFEMNEWKGFVKTIRLFFRKQKATFSQKFNSIENTLQSIQRQHLADKVAF